MSRYIRQRDGAWRIWHCQDHWHQGLWRLIRERLSVEPPSKHPRTVKFCPAETGEPLFLKIFFGTSALSAFKNVFRRSKAVRSFLLTEGLTGSGLNAPIAIGAGEERYARLLRRSFVVTLPVAGQPLPVFLREQFGARAPGMSVRQKREILEGLAREIRTLHDLGFVHGDLVPGNIFIVAAPDSKVRFVFMDNDRTCRYPNWLPHRLCRRNLVQLNRFPLAGISLQDRMRFFHAYVRHRKLRRRDRKLVQWLEQKTRQRRRQCDAVDASGSFRRLMRWDATVH
ncbi:MAG: lipopolysaccharide kinase InaA family protein [Deltaproteobacteria bacterium]|nr:lipopolysaccharide kinase InaA family protein [Deltaproteobacteria bacterium]